jgi:hypothetical protein
VQQAPCGCEKTTDKKKGGTPPAKNAQGWKTSLGKIHVS